MEGKNIDYYLDNDDEVSTAEVIMMEEYKVLKEIEEGVEANKDMYSEDELNTAAAIMLMNYNDVTKPRIAHDLKVQSRQQKKQLKTPKSAIAKEQHNENGYIDTMEQLREYRI